MNTYDKLSRLYQRWLQRNKLNPLISADDLYYDYCRGEVSLDNGQLAWLKKFNDIWYKSDIHEQNKRVPFDVHDEEGILDLWTDYLAEDKRSFNEYFSEEFGFTCNEDITRKQLKFLCELLIKDVTDQIGRN